MTPEKTDMERLGETGPESPGVISGPTCQQIDQRTEDTMMGREESTDVGMVSEGVELRSINQ